MNKTFKIERDGKQAVIVVRQMAHDQQYKVGSKIKYGTGKSWTVTSIKCAHNPIWSDGVIICSLCNEAIKQNEVQ